MHSPKFDAKAKILSVTINKSTLLNTWKKKVRDDLRRQVIPDPVEFLDFHVVAEDACKIIATEIQSGAYVPSFVTRVTSEKSKGLCRIVVLPNIRDALVLQVLADALWVGLRSKAPTNKSFYAPKDHAFLKMRKGLEDEYGPIAEWIKFQKEILGFSKRKEFIVVTDIANYYDWIRYTGLRSVISDLIDAKEIVLDILIFVLKSMIWQPDYMANHDIGLPQCDLDAPRMLAHTFLFEIDELLRDYPGIEFARYMDDIDIGCDTYPEAKRVLRDLDLTLQSRHLRLNSGKTIILNSKQASEHFCVDQNKLLDKFEKKVNFDLKQKGYSRIPVRFIPWIINKWLDNKRFYNGNGLKLFKRIIGYARLYKVKISKEIFGFAFLEWPSVRDPLLRYVASSRDPFEYIESLVLALESGQIVDQITPSKIAVSIVSAQYTQRFPKPLFDRLIRQLDNELPFHVYGLMWLASRFLDPFQLRKIIDKKSHIWSQEPLLVRIVAGFLPLFRGTKQLASFRAKLTRLGGRIANEIFDFYDSKVFEKDGFQKISKFIGASNKSFANGITHSKFLMLYGYLSNGDFSKNEKAKFLLKHVNCRRDLYYRYMLNEKIKNLP